MQHIIKYTNNINNYRKLSQLIDKYCLFNIKQLTKGNNMNNLKKVGLTALGTALVASSAQAADFSMSATSQIILAGADNGNKGNGWSMSDSITFQRKR